MPNYDVLRLVADNPTLSQALKHVFLKQYESDNITVDMSNEIIGQLTRTKLDGVKKVEAAFKEISKYKTPQPRIERTNPGM